MKLSEREMRIYSAMLSKPDKEWSPEGIAPIAWPDKLPLHWRTRSIQIMRWIVAKTQSMDISVVRTSGSGRGQYARYGLEFKPK